MPNKRVVNDIYKKKWIFNDSNNKISKNSSKTMKLIFKKVILN